MAEYQFELLGGDHQEDGVVYRGAGATIDTDRPLDTMYLNKFRRLKGPTAVPAQMPLVKSVDTLSVFDRPDHAKAPQVHQNDPNAPAMADTTRNTPGAAVVPTLGVNPQNAREGLDADSKENKDAANAPSKTGKAGAGTSEPFNNPGRGAAGPEAQMTPSTSPAKSLGEDVTDDFGAADKAGMKVFKEGRQYFITKEDDTGTALNENKRLTTKDQVNKFIKTHK